MVDYGRVERFGEMCGVNRSEIGTDIINEKRIDDRQQQRRWLQERTLQ